MSTLLFKSTHTFLNDLLNFTVCQDHEYSRIIWSSLSLFFFLLGFPAYVFIFYDWYEKLRVGSNLTPNLFFNLNMSIMDWCFLVLIPPGVLNQFIWHNWRFETAWNGLYSLSVCGRPLLMACICVDSFLAVVRPLSYRNWKSLKPRVAVVVAVWCFTLAQGLAFALDSRTAFSVVSIVPYLVAIVIIVFCDCFILHALRKTGPGGKRTHPQKQRAIQTVVNSFVVSVISYMPPVFMFIVSRIVISDERRYYCSVFMPMCLFSTMGSAVMPLLFLRNIGGFERFKMCCKKV